MNIEREPGDVLPPVGGQLDDAEPTKAAPDHGGPSGRPLERKGQSDTDKSQKSKENAGNADTVDGQTATTTKPLRTRSVRASKSNTTQIKDLEAQPSVRPKPRRSRASSSENVSLPHSSLSINVERVSSDAMPPVTDEAIAFLRDPDARAADLFRLTTASQAFVRYHITNMQRLEAASAQTHAHLLATATKYSPQYEKAVDVLVSKLTRDRPALVEAPAMRLEPSASNEPPAAKPLLHFGLGQPAVTVRLSPKVSALGPASLPPAFYENSIELGISLEQTPHSPGTAESTTSKEESAAVSSAPVTPSGGRRLLHGIEAAIQTATTWLQDKVRSTPISMKPQTLSSSAELASPVSDRSTIVPEEVSRRFLKVDRDYYFLDRTPAFSDRGNKLTTRGEHTEVVRSLMEIAVARGWDSITVKGSESFRRAAWMLASQSGMKVAGYSPNALDLAVLANRPARNSVERNEAKDRSKISTNHGRQHDIENIKAASPSRTTTGSHTSHASEISNPELLSKARSFDKHKPSFVVKNHPDLAPAYGVIDAARKFADANLPEQVREEFVSLARRHVREKIVSGETVTGPKIYMAHEKSKDIDKKTATATATSRDIELAEPLEGGHAPKEKQR